MNTLPNEKIELIAKIYDSDKKLQYTKEVYNIANAINIISRRTPDPSWANNALNRLKDYANACNIQDYPQYMGNFKNDKNYLGRYFFKDETGLEIRFCELYWTEFADTVMLIAKYSYHDDNMDCVTVRNIESSIINKMELPEELRAAYIRYLTSKV